MAGRSGAIAGRQQPEAVLKPGQDVIDGQHPQPDRGQFDRQRQPVQLPAQSGHRRLVVLIEGEPGHHRRRPLLEQGQRLIPAPPALSRPGRCRARHGQRGNRPDALRSDTQGLPAGGKHPQTRHSGQQPGNQTRTVTEQVLAVVQHQQQLLVRQIAGEHSFRITTRQIAQAQCPRDRVPQQRGVLELRQLHQPHPIGKRPPQIPCDMQRQT